MYIIAQAIPLIRVLIVGEGRHKSNADAVSVSGVLSVNEVSKGPNIVTEVDIIGHEGVELVQLPTGRIIRADSDEGLAFQQQSSQAQRGSNQPATVLPNSEEAPPVYDKVHQTWADMGFSKRAWSQSPSASPQSAAHGRNISEVSQVIISS